MFSAGGQSRVKRGCSAQEPLTRARLMQYAGHRFHVYVLLVGIPICEEVLRAGLETVCHVLTITTS